MEAFAKFHDMVEGELCCVQTPGMSFSSDISSKGTTGDSKLLSIRAVKSKHRELCFGLVIYWNAKAVLGWTVSEYGDSSQFGNERAFECYRR